MPDLHPPATPEDQLDKLRAAQHADRARVDALLEAIDRRGEDIARWRMEDKRVDKLASHGVKLPWVVISEADRAEANVGGLDEVNFLVVALAILRHETGIPQRAIFGHDHPDPGNVPPYYGQKVTAARGLAFAKALHANPMGMMNGVHWTQTTWYEKAFRVEQLSRDLTSAQAHLRVCLGDLATLIKARGLAGGVEGYNGSGPAAVEYRTAILGTEMRVVRGWL